MTRLASKPYGYYAEIISQPTFFGWAVYVCDIRIHSSVWYGRGMDESVFRLPHHCADDDDDDGELSDRTKWKNKGLIAPCRN